MFNLETLETYNTYGITMQWDLDNEVATIMHAVIEIKCIMIFCVNDFVETFQSYYELLVEKQRLPGSE